jgi:hypothetical protein
MYAKEKHFPSIPYFIIEIMKVFDEIDIYRRPASSYNPCNVPTYTEWMPFQIVGIDFMLVYITSFLYHYLN